MKIGFLGGSFDPVHFGHLLVAQDAYEQHQLDRVVFVPAAQAPWKTHETSSAEERRTMLQAAIAGDPRFEISDYELGRGGISYTIDSARHFRNLYPRDELYWIVGADQLPKLHLWREIEELVRLIEFIVLERPGYPAEAPTMAGLRWHRCRGHLLEMSSSELRSRVKRNLPLDYFMPHNAIVYLQENHLYR